MPELKTIEEVATMLNISTRTVRRLCSAGEIPHIYVGNQIRFDETDLQNYLNQNKKGAINNE